MLYTWQQNSFLSLNFLEKGTNRPDMPRGVNMLQLLATEFLSVAKQNNIPLRGKNMLYNTIYDMQ